MASKMIKVQDIDDKVLQCPICRTQLKQPKILPCLHRYCRDCLVRTVKIRARNIGCPTCREIHQLPPNGVDGFKTDFNTNNIIELIQSQHAVKKDAPMCHVHPEKPLEMVCITCGNQPICVSCLFGTHKGHDLHEFSTFAKIERKKLTKKMAEVMRYKDKIYNRRQEMKTIKRKLCRSVNAKKEELQEEFNLNANKIKTEIRGRDDQLERRKKELEGIETRKVSLRRQELEIIIKDATQKYDKFRQDERQKTDRELDGLHTENNKENEELYQKLEIMNKGIKDLLSSLQARSKVNSRKITELSNHIDQIVERFETVTATASSILPANHNWTDMQYIPNIRAEMDALIEEVKKDFPGLETLCDITVGGLSSSPGRGVKITEREESVVNIERVTGGKWTNTGITCNKDGSIVITGRASEYHSHITVINIKGKMIKHNIKRATSPFGARYCASLSQFKMATVCEHNEIGVYTIDGTSRETNISDITSSWPALRDVSCVAADNVNNYIIVGGDGSRDLYVFNGELDYNRTITLPEVIEWPYDMTVHGGNLLVCGDAGRAYVVTMKERSACQILHEFTKPDIGEGDREPISVCTDKNGFVYMIWRTGISGQERSILVQYSPDGRNLLQTRLVECKDDIRCITVVETEQGDKILMATLETGKLITYGLVKSGI